MKKEIMIIYVIDKQADIFRNNNNAKGWSISAKIDIVVLFGWKTISNEFIFRGILFQIIQTIHVGNFNNIFTFWEQM